MRNVFMALLIIFAGGAVRAAAGDVQAFLKVSPLAGESKTSKSGGSRGLIRQTTINTSQSSSKTITRNMKWNCEVRYRGKPRPEKVEVRVFYIGYEANNMTPKILGKDVKNLTLDENGKASVELESPTVKLSKTRTGGGTGGYGHVTKTKSTSSGQRMAGCVVQLFENGELVKSYASMSQWDRAAKEKDFSDAVLNRKDKNRLN